MKENKSVDILLVEDNLDDAELTIRALKKYHLVNNLLHLEDGEAALKYLFSNGTKNNLRLILLDLKMPKVDGMEVLKQIKSDDNLKVIPTVILTSSHEEKDIIHSYQMGANAYIVKPVEFEEYLNTVNTLGSFWLSINQYQEQ